jgi:hypothetical protein
VIDNAPDGFGHEPEPVLSDVIFLALLILVWAA